MTPKLTIQIVGFNSAPVLAGGLTVLENLSPDTFTIHYIDNHSTDDSVALVRQLIPQAKITMLPHNMGYARAHNLGIAVCQTPFILLHDPDVTISEQGIVSLLGRFSDPTVGAVQGKLLRTAQHGTQAIIDSAGIELSLALNGIERGANTIDYDQFATEARLLAVTGACGMYRVSALKAVAHNAAEFLDNEFFSYKEDIDIGWRLNKAGWKVLYLPILAGYHQRTLGRRGLFNWGIKPGQIYRRLKSQRTRFSLRNWVWLIIKNASLPQLMLHGLPILIRAAVFFLLSCLYPPLLKTWLEIIAGIPTCLRKRFAAAKVI